MTVERESLDRRREIQRLLAAAGQPPAPDPAELERAVRRRLATTERPRSGHGWNWWAATGVLAASLAVGVLSAAWRVQPVRGEADPQTQYLQWIDPRLRVSDRSQR